MASVVDICNLALAHLGDQATVSAISPSDGSAQADHCKRFYPIARDSLLEMHDWNFARRRAELAETANTPPDTWGYEYAMPANVIRILAVLDADGDESKPKEFMQGSDSSGNLVIWTNEETAQVLYTRAVTDTTKFGPLFTNALSWLLASYLAGPITKDGKVKESAYKMFNIEFSRAAVKSANANHRAARANTPDWLKVRGTINPFLADGKVIE